MKTIKIHISLWATIAALLTGGCTSYPDDFGFCADLSEPQMSGMTLKPTGYDVTVKTPIAEYDEGTGITRVGYLVNGEERPCELTYSETDGGYCLIATLQDLQFGLTYAIQPFIGDGVYLNNGKTLYVNRQKSTYKPVLGKSEWWMNAEGEVTWKAYYTCAAPGFRPVESVTATLGGKAIEATISDDGKEVSVNLGSAYKLDVGEYAADVTLAVTNSFGDDSRTESYAVTVSEATGRFPDDGNKEDCIRVCGIDWAKGLFYYDQATKTYKIGENQWSYPDDLGMYFQKANGQGSVENGMEINNSRVELKGNPKYDVVTQYLNTWATPSISDFQLLIDNTSVQPCNVIDKSGKSIPGFLFLFPSDTGKRFVSTASFINVSYEDVDNLGLFLSGNGYMMAGGSVYSRERTDYMSSTVSVNTRYSPPRIEACFFLGNTKYIYDHTIYISSDQYYRYNIRPIKL